METTEKNEIMCIDCRFLRQETHYKFFGMKKKYVYRCTHSSNLVFKTNYLGTFIDKFKNSPSKLNKNNNCGNYQGRLVSQRKMRNVTQTEYLEESDIIH